MEEAITKEQLKNNWKSLIRDLETVLSEVKDDLGDKAVSVRTRLERNLEAAKERLAEIEDDIKDQASAAVEATDEYVRDNPWQSAGVALGVGFVLGVLLSRISR
jgi:ElaB/YqjD/DUF883 family membrane-anchored ribosome-binding protein